MQIQKIGGAIALIYAGIPVIIAGLSTSAEQGIISATIAATIVALLQCALRIIDINGWGQRSAVDDFELIGNVAPARSPQPGIAPGHFLYRVLIGDRRL